mgnify:FL=1
MRFASNFSIVTDSNIRRDTIEKWIDKIIDYVNESDELRNKIKIWMQNIYPDIKEREVDRRFEKELFKSFESNLRITLIIDELTQEQKDTLSNVVKSSISILAFFKLFLVSSSSLVNLLFSEFNSSIFSFKLTLVESNDLFLSIKNRFKTIDNDRITPITIFLNIISSIKNIQYIIT